MIFYSILDRFKYSIILDSAIKALRGVFTPGSVPVCMGHNAVVVHPAGSVWDLGFGVYDVLL